MFSYASVFLTLNTLARGQTLQPKLLLNRYPTFKASDIKDAGIKRIRIKEMTKPSSRPVYDQNIRFNYYFDQKGRLAGYKKTYPGFAGKIDTILIQYAYQHGAKTQEIETLGLYKRSVEYKPQNDSITYREIKTKRGKQTWELFEKEKVETIRFKNGKAEMIGGLYDVPYQKIITEWNSDSTSISKETWNGSRIHSKYKVELRNDSLIQYSYTNVLNESTIKIDFPSNYETSKGRWCDNEQCLSFSIVIDKDGWPKGLIFMNEETEDILIWEIDYF